MSANAARQRAIDESGWADDFQFVQKHNPAFWLYCILIVLGSLQFVNAVAPSAQILAPALVVGTIMWALFLIPWVWFLNHRDRFHRSIPKVALVGFGWGALVATWVMALPGNAAIMTILGKFFGADFVTRWGASLAAPLVEESSKGVGIVMLALLARPFLRNAYDGLVLGSFVGIGFEVAEDWWYGFQGAQTAFGINQFSAELQIFVLRGTWISLVSHALYSALVGAGIGWWISTRGQPISTRLPKTVLLILGGCTLHFFWDSVGALGPFILPVAFINAIILILIVRKWAMRGQRVWVRDLLAPEMDAGLVTADEIDLLAGTPHERRKHVHDIRRRHGRQAGKAARHVLDAELDLMDVVCRSRGETNDEVRHAESEIARLRAVATSS